MCSTRSISTHLIGFCRCSCSHGEATRAHQSDGKSLILSYLIPTLFFILVTPPCWGTPVSWNERVAWRTSTQSTLQTSLY